MIKRILFVAVSCIFLMSCSAFEHDDLTLPVDAQGNPSLSGFAGTYEGVYKGAMTLSRNECEGAGATVEMPDEVTADVLQSGDIMSIQFGDGMEATGTMKDNSVVLVFKDVSVSKIYRLDFNEDGITGICEVSETTVSGDLSKTCAEYSLELSPAAEDELDEEGEEESEEA